MSKKPIALIALLVVALVAGSLYLGVRLGERRAQQGMAGLAPARAPVSAMPPIPGLPPGTLGSVPAGPQPWATPNGMNGQAFPPTTPQAAERSKRLAELRAMQAEIVNDLQNNHHADPRQVDALLAKLEQTTGSTVINGINIESLRQTLAKSQEMQSIAQAMHQESLKPGGADPKVMKAYTDRLQALQQQMVGLQANMGSVNTGTTK